MAPEADVVIVVGSPNSSNSNRLREVAANRGVPAYMIDRADELRARVGRGQGPASASRPARRRPRCWCRRCSRGSPSSARGDVRELDGVARAHRVSDAEGPDGAATAQAPGGRRGSRLTSGAELDATLGPLRRMLPSSAETTAAPRPARPARVRSPSRQPAHGGLARSSPARCLRRHRAASSRLAHLPGAPRLPRASGNQSARQRQRLSARARSRRGASGASHSSQSASKSASCRDERDRPSLPAGGVRKIRRIQLAPRAAVSRPRRNRRSRSPDPARRASSARRSPFPCRASAPRPDRCRTRPRRR